MYLEELLKFGWLKWIVFCLANVISTKDGCVTGVGRVVSSAMVE